MSGLLLADTIHINSNYGPSKIELFLGSVTKTTDPVDVLVISAYPGDYQPTETSVIGALLRDLRISVRQLATNKEEDLRKYWSCWWSKPLPQNKPYKRIMCFEGSFKRNARPPTTVSEVFRSLVSLCKNQDTTVMLPLLATGDQNYSNTLMLRLIVEAAIKWINVGLPLRVIKIVVYSRNLSYPGSSEMELVNCFQHLKNNWMMIKDENSMIHKKPTWEYDIYLAYSHKEQWEASLLTEEWAQNGFNVFKDSQAVNDKKAWQDQIYEMMQKSERVVALLSPSFLSDVSCIEKYNMALCCAHALKRDYLVPLYIEEVKDLPTYMVLTQFIDCRPKDHRKMLHACGVVSSCLKKESPSSMSILKKNNMKKDLSLDDHYDVFISYSHKDTTIANTLWDFIKHLRPEWNVFVDQEGLRVGSSWQSELYTSIGILANSFYDKTFYLFNLIV